MKSVTFLKANLGLLLVLIAFFLYSLLSIVQHNYFKTAAFDLGIYDQTVWLYSRFHLPISSIKEQLQLADHFGPILILFAPFYLLWSDPRMLLLLQAGLVAGGGIPAYLLAKEKLGEFFASVILLGYLSFIGAQYAIGFDFHLATISVFFIIWTYYFALKKNWPYYWFFFSLAIICKEDVSLLLVGLGVYLVCFVNRKIGLLTIMFGSLYFFLVEFVIMKALGSSTGYLNFDSLGKTPPEMVSFVLLHPLQTLWILVDDPIKTHTQEALFSSFSYLPFFSIFGWLTILPHLAERFLSSYSGRWQLFWHYSVNSTPSLTFGTIMAVDYLVKLGQKVGLNKKRLVFAFGVVLLLSIYSRENLYQPPLWNLQKKDFWQMPKGVEDSNKLIKLIPVTGSVLALSALLPHLSQRQEIYMLGLHKKETQFVVLNVDLFGYPAKELAGYLNNPKYTLISKIGNGYLFGKVSP